MNNYGKNNIKLFLTKVYDYCSFKLLLKYLNLKIWYLGKKFSRVKPKNLFIDCGSNLGQGFKFFKNYFKLNNFDYILIEPNPHCANTLKKLTNDKVSFIGKGVWTKEEKLNLFSKFINEDKHDEGASFLKNHNSANHDLSNEAFSEIETISLSDLIKEKKPAYNSIIVKLDIESSEFIVIPDLVEKKSIELIDHIFVEFHSQYFDSKEKTEYLEIEKKLIKKIKSKNVGFTKWI